MEDVFCNFEATVSNKVVATMQTPIDLCSESSATDSDSDYVNTPSPSPSPAFTHVRRAIKKQIATRQSSRLQKLQQRNLPATAAKLETPPPNKPQSKKKKHRKKSPLLSLAREKNAKKNRLMRLHNPRLNGRLLWQ